MRSDGSFRSRAWALAAFFAVCFLALAGMWVFAGGDPGLGGRPYRVQAVVPSAVTLATNADVRQSGVKVGRVAQIAGRGDKAVLLLDIADDHAPVYRDARVLVRTKTQLGENYVDLDPGSPSAPPIANGGLLSPDSADPAVQVDQILSMLDHRRRRSLQRVIDGLGSGLENRGGDLNRFLEGSSALVSEGGPVLEILADDREQVAGLVDDFGWLMRTIGDRKDSIQRLAVSAKRLSEAVAARDSRLRAMLDELPGFLHQARTTAPLLGSTSTELTPVVRDLTAAAENLTPAVRRLPRASSRGKQALGALGSFSRRAGPLVRQLGPFARAAQGLQAPVEAYLRQANPLQAYLTPYWGEFGQMFGTLRAASGTHDALSHYSHTQALLGPSGFAGGVTPGEREAIDRLMDIGLLAKLDRIRENPYPEPGTADKPVPFKGKYPRLKADPPYRQKGTR